MKADAKTALDKFIPAARAFCDFVDGSTQMNRSDFFKSLLIQLARICQAGVSLPTAKSASDGSDHESEDLAARQMRWKKLINSLRKILGAKDIYWVLFDQRSTKKLWRVHSPMISGIFTLIFRNA